MGLVFVPTGSAARISTGGERKGDNRYANSVTAVRAATGEVVWSFQVVHHDLWDYDVASQPVLIAYGEKPGHQRLLSQQRWDWCSCSTERRGNRFRLWKSGPFRRVMWPGEAASPTQPFPVAIEPLAPAPSQSFRQQRGGSEMVYRSIQANCGTKGLFTPRPASRERCVPGNAGAWHGADLAYDPERSLLIVNTNRLATVVRLIPRDQVEAARGDG